MLGELGRDVGVQLLLCLVWFLHIWGALFPSVFFCLCREGERRESVWVRLHFEHLILFPHSHNLYNLSVPCSISEYDDEAMLIPQNTSLIIRRVAGWPRLPILIERDKYIAQLINAPVTFCFLYLQLFYKICFISFVHWLWLRIWSIERLGSWVIAWCFPIPSQLSARCSSKDPKN